MVDVKDHPCAQHCYDFECNLKDSCDNVDGVVSGPNVVEFKSAGGVLNLGKFVCFPDVNEKKIALDAINVNPCGFAISLWFFANDVTDVDARFFSKTGALPTESHKIQSHVVSAQLSDQKLKFRLKLGKDPKKGTTQWLTNNIVSINTWHHAVFWYDSCDGDVRIYLDGVQQQIQEFQEQVNPGPNEAHKFSEVKGKPVFQGPQLSAAGSQPSNVGMFGGWRVFDGCMDQLIIWKTPISQKVIDDLYNGGDGKKQVSLEKALSCARFPSPQSGKSCFLTLFKQVLCVKSCFDTLCDLLCNDCTLLSLSVDGVYLVKDIGLSGWPGSLDILEIKTKDDKTFYTLRLCLDTDKFYRCPLNVNNKTVQLTVTAGGSVKTPLKPFVITGFCRDSQKSCC
uniref:Concanavalin A-like lectin/glucanase superfamily protein n=1 Tax=Mimivirus LCMiAC02 TaxID=2506609 RepID=A0A4D5XER6_9VIRU|nr:MAG: concanavalin A-like lectin/glucanase superfamily protein [Mimivirus LCMiAC02]